ncbi:cation:proton antiporter [Halonatronum saccharophilum]|uniref:cation:proton antiporter n=1 Tax=Halonatronum saccharophilum TaxID=150060 RepID=UPI0004AEBC72|nr:cation:proton antiporter [Halonatronum saccharophilum]
MLLSIFLILTFGLILGFIFEKMKLPSLLGMLIAGILIGPTTFNLLDENLLAISQDIRTMALIIILLKAGLGISKDTIKKIGGTAIKMGSIPVLVEGAAVALLATIFFDLPWMEAGLLGFIIAAVSPAVVVPSMLKLKETNLGEEKEIPTLILASASLDDVFAITLFSIFLGIFERGNVSIREALVQVPYQIIGGILLGLLIGYLIIKFYRTFDSLNLSYRSLILVVIAIGTYALGGFIGVASLLSIMTIGYLILEQEREMAKEFSAILNELWMVAKIFLFVLIGAAVELEAAFGAGLLGLLLIFLGLVARSIGVLLSTHNSYLNFKERIFCAVSYLPKATVQAAIGAVPLAAGVPSGELILALAVMSIVFTAPIGAIGIEKLAPHLLEGKTE